MTKKVGADQADKLAQSLSNATVDLNPHQIDAALFAFRSPLSRGAILADEVGLGKTIEAGIVVSQLWAEKKRRILAIVPATLRKQWSRELTEKFFLPSIILETKSFRELSKTTRSPFEQLFDVVGDDFEPADALEEEWPEGDSGPAENTTEGLAAGPSLAKDGPAGRPSDAKSLREEAAELAAFKTLAESIQQNAKGDALLKALRAGFSKAAQLGALPRALIFTESRRTQTDLRGLLETNGYAGQIVLFNGTNTDPGSKRVHKEWLARHAGQECVSGSPTADMRAALVEEFAERAAIMIATESAAEGVNLQFCSLVVNYDLPWNPQRVEQRIGRCHRYGQKHDVVVINFVNRANEADKRVFELLNEKFKLFDGVFGASDEVLGAVGSGIDIEKRINVIYKHCRTAEEIQQAFDQLQRDLDEPITATLKAARAKLLENFDEDVHQKLRLRQSETEQKLDRYEDWLWALTATELAGHADFDLAEHRFTLTGACAGLPEGVSPGRYRLRAPADRELDGDVHYRPGHPLAEALLSAAKARELPCRELLLDYDRRGAA